MYNHFTNLASTIRHLPMLKVFDLSYTDHLEKIHIDLIFSCPKFAYAYVKHFKRENIPTDILNRLEQIIATSTSLSLAYSMYILDGPFPLGELAISKSANSSYFYAKYALYNKFELGEKAIATDPFYAYEYAVSVIRNKFELGEPAIFSNPKFSFWYRDFIERHSCDN